MKKYLAMAIMALLLILGCGPLDLSQGAFDKQVPASRDMVDTQTKFFNQFTYVRIITTGNVLAPVPTKRGKWRLQEARFRLEGSGTVLTDDTIITAAHVVNPGQCSVNIGTSTVWTVKPYKVIERSVLILDYKGAPIIGRVQYMDLDRDIALVKFSDPLNVLMPLNKKIHLQVWGTGMLENGDALMLVKHQRGEQGELLHNIYLDRGKVISTDLDDLTIRRALPWFGMYDFSMSVPVIPGDSGSPVFAFLEGKPYLIGIGRAIFDDKEAQYMTFISSWIGRIFRYVGIY